MDALCDLLVRAPRRLLHDADILLDLLGALQKKGGESFREQLVRLKLGEKLYAFSGTTQPAEVEVSEAERQWLAARLADPDIKLNALPVVVGLCLLDVMEQLGLELTTDAPLN